METWYALADTGNVIYLGEFADISEADDKTTQLKINCVWLFDAETFTQWTNQIKATK